ncbi:type II toxin-antitoxin system RelE/ParE family toxin [Morganella psychrotolerans]|uniref:Addiction module toxin RelE n=1 Tax=Morganella psychrotolerans TaxID=368603 RepID=A0A1B8HDC6_9GAMM|nr:type II toxin-antitoxin system RelE/ParE family toxin [Morganella psychrotolerans]OBU07083.1 addiction module toxin RelE [Morganella psychrotolerans]
MSAEQNEIDVYQSAKFEKTCKKLPEKDLKVVEDEIDKIIDNPLIGELKKGDLAYLHVHKFRLNELTVLLGYSWISSKLELYLLNIGSHENFYEKQKKSSKADLKLINS